MSSRRPTPEPFPLRITIPDELPLAARAEEVRAAIDAHQVVIVAGETGSGKSTQLPKLCLELGRGRRADGRGTLIGHTQPRRLAARTVADRVRAELHDAAAGDDGRTAATAAVGHAVRFSDTVGPDTRVKVMTDGILLNELQRDRDLRAYDTLIIDEAHERSLNIDFILGYLRQLLPRRPDLKVIVTSATIDTERFAAHFAPALQPVSDTGCNTGPEDGAPIIEVSGRTYPVEIRYRPPEDGDVTAAAADAVEALVAEGMADVLVFGSGEREIRDTVEEIEGRRLPHLEVIPLFSRLSAAEQQRVFAPHDARRVIVATNIAETSLTVPGVLSVVDPGMARVSRYNTRTKVQRLPIEPISQASADQRSGRSGRVAPGVCIRLYDEDDFLDRPAFTEPEILRTNLASVILQMTALGLGDVESFPFVEAPDRRLIADGVRLLEELGALEPDRPAHDRALTDIGRQLARLPLDPTLGRMVLAAAERDCVHEVMVLAAALSIQDVREYPSGAEQQAGERHARFVVPGSDFLTLLAIWDHVRERQRALSSSKFRREVRDDFLHYVRIREWQDVYSQLRQVARSMKLPINRDSADPDDIHRALLAGLLANVGRRDDDDAAGTNDKGRSGRGAGRRGPDRRRGPVSFTGPRGATFSIGRRSVLRKAPPRWVIAAELVETNRLWASTMATVAPEWIEHAAAHLVTRRYDGAQWDSERGAARVIERVNFRSLPLVEGRTINLDRVDPALARELFIRHALVRGEWTTHHRFVADNAAAVEDVRDAERRARREDILVGEDERVDFFDARIPEHITDVRRFDRWWKDTVRDEPDRLTYRPEDLTRPDADTVDDDAFPAVWTSGPVDDGDNTGDAAAGAPLSVPIAIDYEFEPGDVRDGATFEIPLAALNRTDAAPFDWLVPGLRVELVTALIKALPKAMRRQLVPAPDRAAEVVARIGPDDGALFPTLADALTTMAGVEIRPEVWADVELPAHLRPWFRVVDDDTVVAEGHDLAALVHRLRPTVRAQIVAAAGASVEVAGGIVDWSIGDLARVVETRSAEGIGVLGYPALVDLGDDVGVRVLATESDQHALHWNGVRRLLRRAVPDRPARTVQRAIDAQRLLGLAHAPHGSLTAAVEDAQLAVIEAVMLDGGGAPFTEAGFTERRDRLRAENDDRLVTAVGLLADTVALAARLRDRLAAPAPAAWSPALDDVTDQVAQLVFADMAVAVGTDRLQHLPRYLEGIEVRLDRLRDNVRRDTEAMVAVRRVMAEHATLVADRGMTAALDEIRWQIEELRVQLFAQQLGTPEPVSTQRIRRALERVRRA